MSAVYNFTDILEGDTLEERVFALKRFVNDELVDLTDAVISFQVFRSNTSKIYIDKNNTDIGGVSIVSQPLCLVKILEIKDHGLTAAEYYWRLVVLYPDGDIKTYLGGKFNVKTIKQYSDV